MSDSDNLRVLELYSGIGGMHWALKESGIPFEVVMAVDINTTANHIYKHNFPEVNLNSFGIEKLSLKKLRTLRPNAILMSPPCQPFSRVGKKGDCDDIRTKSFLHILQLLQQVDVKPDLILVENVKGFEVSRTRQLLIDALSVCHYAYQEYLLTPLQFGIPNSRLRYYLIAKLKSCPNPLVESHEFLYSIPDLTQNSPCSQNLPNSYGTDSSPPQAISHVNDIHTCSNTHFSNNVNTSTNICENSSEGSGLHTDKCIKNNNQEHEKYSRKEVEEMEGDRTLLLEKNAACDINTPKTEENTKAASEFSELIDAGRNMRYCEESDDRINDKSQPLCHFMEGGEEKDFEHLLVSDKNLRQFVVMDVVLPQLKKSTCFTKRYAHYMEGAGSLVQMSSSVQDTHAASCFKSKAVELKNKHEWGEEELSIVRRLKLRYFSPREVANLLCFPKDFEFPQDVSDIQKYRCLGNSLNVHVVARLIQILMAGDGFR